MPDDAEYLAPDDYGALTRADHARKAATDHYEYLVQRLWAKYHLGLNDAFEIDGRITRVTEEVPEV